MAYVHTDPPELLECVQELGSGSNQDKRTELELESPRGKCSDERGGLKITEAASSDAPQLDGGAPGAKIAVQEKHADEMTKVGKGLESIGDLTLNTLQRVASAVGGVVKAPAVVLANVGGLGSNGNSPTSSRGTSLVERVVQLERQMPMLEEKYNSKTLASEFNLSPRSHPTTPRSKEKLRTARSLLQETETEETLVERLQILEDRITDHMESIEKALANIEKALASIQSKLAHVDSGILKSEILPVQDAAELQESPSGEEFHDADQGSDNLELMETPEQKPFEEVGVGSDVPGEASGTSSTFQDALVKQPLAAAPTAEPIELAQEDGAGKSDIALASPEPQTATTLEEVLVKEPLATAASAKLEDPAQEDAADKAGTVLAAAESPLTSTVEEPQNGTVGSVTEDKHVQNEAEYKSAEDVKVSTGPQDTLMKEPLAAAPTAEPTELAQDDGADKSGTMPPYSELELASTLGEPQNALTKEPSTVVSSAKLEDPAQEDGGGKSGIALASPEEPQPAFTLEEPQKVLLNEPLAAASTTEPAQEDGADKSGTVLPSPEPQLASSLEDPLAAVPSAKLQEPDQEDSGGKSGIELPSPEPQLASSLEDPLAAVPSINLEEPVQEAGADKSGTVLPSPEPQLASSLEDPLAALPSAKLEEPVQEAGADKSGTMLPSPEPQLASSLEDPLAAVPSAELEDPAQEDGGGKSGIALASPEPQPASTLEERQEVLVKEPLAAAASGELEDSAQGDAADKAGTVLAAAESPLASTAEGRQNGTSHTPQDQLVEEPLGVAPTADPTELAQEDGADMSGTLLPSPEPQLASSPPNALAKEPLAAVPSAKLEEPVQEDDALKSGTALTSPEEPEPAPTLEGPHEVLVKEPLPAAASVELGEPAQEDAAEKADTVLAAAESPLASTAEGRQIGISPTPQDELVNEPLAAAPTAEPTELAQEDGADMSGTVLPSPEPQLASSVEDPPNVLAKEPSAAVPSAKLEEPVQEDGPGKSGIALASPEPQLASILKEPQEVLVKEPLAASAELEEPALSCYPFLTRNSARYGSQREEPAQGDAAYKAGTVLAAAESLSASSVEEPVTEDNHVQNEAEHKSADDVKVSTRKPEAFQSYDTEPKPFWHKEKKREKKEKRQDGIAEEKDKKSSLRAEEKNQHPFKHVRDRFKRAFRSNK